MFRGSSYFGISLDEDYRLLGFAKNGWADRYTNLREYIGWKLIKINEVDTTAFATMKKVPWKAGDQMTFTLQKVQIMFSKQN